jgi:hypothetical protein
MAGRSTPSDRRAVPLRRRLLRLAGSLALLAVSIAVPLVVAELVLRWKGLGDPQIYTTNLTDRYELAPNQDVARFGGSRVKVDSVGLRSVRDWSLAADRKILFLGDSVTYGGAYIDTAALFSERTCVHLGLPGSSTCGNGGVNAYGTDNMAARVLYKPFHDESAVVVTLIGPDTTRGLVVVQSLPYFTRKPFGPFPALVELFAYSVDWWRSRVRFNGPYEEPMSRDHEMEVAGASLDGLFEALRARRSQGVAVLVVFSPIRTSLQNGLEPIEAFVLGRLVASGLDHIDMTAVLKGADLEAIYHDKVHLDPPGHDLYGRHIAERLATMLR